MSDNKYIIDKDSLTGIADAVRDKLGNGKAITDENAGYYPVPIKKLGYHETAGTASYSGPGTGYTGNTIYARPISELVNICGIRPSYIKVTVTNSSGFNTNDIIFRCTNPNQPDSTRVDSVRFANYIAILPIPSDIEDCNINYGAYYSTYSSQYSKRNVPAYDVVFLDSNQNEININEYSGNSFTVDQWGSSETFLTKPSFEKIPFSIDDIQDRITNSLVKSSSSLIAHEGLGYGYLSGNGNIFYSDNVKYYFLTFIPLNAGQKIGFCIGKTASNRLRAGFFSGKTYNNFSQYVENSSSNSQIYSDGISVTGSTEPSGDGLLKRCIYTAPADGVLVVFTSNESKLAFLHVWEA